MVVFPTPILNWVLGPVLVSQTLNGTLHGVTGAFSLHVLLGEQGRHRGHYNYKGAQGKYLVLRGPLAWVFTYPHWMFAGIWHYKMRNLIPYSQAPSVPPNMFESHGGFNYGSEACCKSRKICANNGATLRSLDTRSSLDHVLADTCPDMSKTGTTGFWVA